MAMSSAPEWTTSRRRFTLAYVEPTTPQSSFGPSLERPPSLSKSSAGPQEGSFGLTRGQSKSRLAVVKSDRPPTKSLRSSNSSFFRSPSHHKPKSASSEEAQTCKGNEEVGHPVVVFGFSSDNEREVVDHFAEFGKVLTLSTSDLGEQDNKVKSIRLVYEQESAARRALLENGTVFDKKFRIGCIEEAHTCTQSSGNSESSYTGNLGNLKQLHIKSDNSVFQKPVKRTNTSRQTERPSDAPARGWGGSLVKYVWELFFNWENV